MKAHGAALIFAMVFPTLMAWFYFVQLARQPDRPSTGPASRPNPVVVAVYGGAKLFQFAFPAAWVWWYGRRPIWPSRPQSRGLGMGLAFGGVVLLGTIAFYFLVFNYTHFLEQTPPKIRGKIMEFGVDSPALYILFGLVLSLVHSLLEEYYWRGFVFGGLRQYVSLGWAIGISGLAFMSHHVITLAVFFPGNFWTMAVPLAAAIAVGGAFWAWLYDRSGSIYASWFSHLLVDVGIMAVGFDMLFRK
ncbi:MAG TPA: type II CAAX endopeptidase family protein [Gemmataceae bacterium]|nr:type II CAAX endopeptidase family protein [Gemmataceae bacterium]